MKREETCPQRPGPAASHACLPVWGWPAPRCVPAPRLSWAWYSLRLALQRDRLAHQGGVLTPATAFGTTLATRLSEHGLRFETSIFDGPYIPPPPAV